MNHEDYQQLASQFIDYELGPESEQELFLHLGACTECRNFLKASWQLHADIFATKPRRTVETGTKRREDRGRFDADRIALSATANRSLSSRIRTAALLIVLVLIIGLFWSATISMQPEQQVILVPMANGTQPPNWQP
jgi:predicted anti-sigma-YlaC factor YlaD